MTNGKVDEVIIKTLRKKGFRVTPQRIAISKTMLLNKDHPSAESIYEEVKRVHPTLSLSTVYNTLHILKKLELIHELTFNDDITRFDGNVEPHINLVCRSCGRIFDVMDDSLTAIINRAEKKMNFHSTGQRFDLYGFCKRCRKG